MFSMTTLSLTLQAVAEPGWFGPALDAIVTLLSIPVVSSVVTSVIRRAVDEGINPRVIVWFVAVGVTAVAYTSSDIALPLLDPSDLPGFVAGLIVLATGFAEVSKLLYDTILRRLPFLAPDA